MTKHFLIFALIFALSLFLFYPSLNYYFFQDDWFVLNWVRTGDLASFFKFRTDIIYWRPLSMPIFFAIGKLFFGLNPLGFHIISFITFCLLIIAIYYLFKSIIVDRKLALLASFMYGIWPIHFISLSWLASTSYILGSLFQVLSFLFFIEFIKEKKPSFYFASFIMFLTGLASSELTLVLPVIFLSWGFFLTKENHLKKILPFLFVVFAYLFLRFVLFPIPAKGDYKFYFDKQIINNFLWYLGWAFGLPERFKSLVFFSSPRQSIDAIIHFWQITIPFILLVFLIAKFIFTKLRKNLQYYFFGSAWIILGLSPVIFLVNHSYPVYLSFAGLGFIYLILISIGSSKNKSLLILVILWISISYSNLQFTRATHWIENEQAISKAYTTYTKNRIANPKPGTGFLLKPADLSFSRKNGFTLKDKKDIFQSLNNQSSLQVVYNDSTIRSFYANHLEPITIPANINVFEINPSLNE